MEAEIVLGEFRMGGRAERMRVLDQPFAHFIGQVQAGMGGVADLELLDNAQGLQVVVEAVAIRSHDLVQRVLAGVAERRVAEVVGQRQRLRQIGVQAERLGDGAGNLGHLERVGEPVAEMVGVAAGKDLGLVFQAPEGTRVDHPVAVALVLASVGMRDLGKAASAGVSFAHCAGGQHGEHYTGRVEPPASMRYHRYRKVAQTQGGRKPTFLLDETGWKHSMQWWPRWRSGKASSWCTSRCAARRARGCCASIWISRAASGWRIVNAPAGL